MKQKWTEEWNLILLYPLADGAAATAVAVAVAAQDNNLFMFQPNDD